MTKTRLLAATAAALVISGAASGQERPSIAPWDGIEMPRNSLSPDALVRALIHGRGNDVNDLMNPIGAGSAGGLQAAAQHILDQQCVNGGFGWPHDDCGTTYNNITAPIMLGVLDVYEMTGYSPYLDAALDAGDYDLTYEYGNGESRFGAFAAYFLWKLSAVSGDTTYSDHAETEFFDELDAATYGPSDFDTAGWIAAVETARTGTWVNLRPWEFHNLVEVAAAIGNPGQAALFVTGVLDGLDTLDNTDPGTVYSDIIGLAGGVRGLALSGTTTFTAISAPSHGLIDGIDNLCDLVDVLVDLQNADGSWYWHSDLASPGEGDKDTQTTAYALMALVAAEDAGCGPCAEQIKKARSWIASMQDTDGGYFSYPGGTHNTEVEGEALNGLTLSTDGTLALIGVDCPDDTDGVEAGYQIEVELWMLDLVGPATGYQAFIEYDTAVLTYRDDLSSYTGAPFSLHIQTIVGSEVSPGEIRLDGSDVGGGGGSAADSLLATLVFDVDVECLDTSVDFDLTQAFDSELSFEGLPIATSLLDTIAMTLDDTPPVIDPCPADITVPADADVGDGCTGAVVTWTDPGASDNCGGVTVVCAPPSGSTFAIGTTTVTCTATDDCGNTDFCTFDVTVTATNLIDVTVELPGSMPTTRCIHFVTDDCGNAIDVSLVFTDHDADIGTPVQATALIEVPCNGTVTFLCGKDEQHTKWDTTSVSIAGPIYVADSIVSLLPGDTDNDGDVDINDVTYLVLTFGDLAAAGGCAWDGVTRDADFDNDGAVGSPDYSLQTAEWLTLSSCACSAPLQGDVKTRVDIADLAPGIGQAIDFNGDGVFDFQDVVIFESRNDLPHTLSSLIQATEQQQRTKR